MNKGAEWKTAVGDDRMRVEETRVLALGGMGLETDLGTES